MKLHELINEHEFPKAKTHVKRVNVPDIYDYDDEEAYWDEEDDGPEKQNPAANDPDIEKLGIGAFATAYKHKKNPYDVVKGSRATRNPDGFVAFFDALSKDKEAQANPYFPRFRSMNKFKHKYSDKQSYMSRMEPLEAYQNLNDGERKALVHRLFSEHGRDVIRHYYEQWYRDYFKKEIRVEGDKLYDMEIVAWAIRKAVEDNEWGDELRWEIKDKKFEEAVEFLRNAAKKAEFDSDLHYNNMMIRRTSVGPQLVITDPFGGSSSRSDEWDEVEGHPDWE